tara:strand:+ start:112 stop:297 length:186 start_codon:yes stop_codon:yes gene_type:complete
MPNHWMDEILKLYDNYYDEDLTHQQLIREVEKIMINYKDEFKKYDDALTADMVEMEGYGQD